MGHNSTRAAESSGPETVYESASDSNIACGAALWCNSPMKRNQFFGPASVNADLGGLKSFRVTENSRFRYEANFFNLFNHPNLSNPNGNTNSGTFGEITSSGGPRVTQMALRYEF